MASKEKNAGSIPVLPRMTSRSGSGSGRSGSLGNVASGGNERIGPGLKYERTRHLGSGNFGDAWLVRSVQSDRNYVIKELKMTPGISQKVKGSDFSHSAVLVNSSLSPAGL